MTNEKPTSPEPDETKTMPVPKAGKIYFGLGRDASYQAAKSGQLPVIWVGGSPSQCGRQAAKQVRSSAWDEAWSRNGKKLNCHAAPCVEGEVQNDP